MKKKILALSLAVFTLTSLLAACGGGKTSSPAETTAAVTTAAAATTTVDASKPLEDPMTLLGRLQAKLKKVSEKPVEYKIVATLVANQIDFKDMEIFKEMEKSTNVKINWECYLINSFNDQKNLMLSSNQIPDAFMGYDTLSMDDINQYGPLGMFIPLDDLIAQNSPTYASRLEQNKTLSGMSTAFDGKRYSYGSVNESIVRNYPDNLYINKTWLDKLGLQIPTNLDEFYDVLTAFKTKDPNGNSKSDEIPYTFTKFNHINGYGSFFGAFGRVDTHNGSAVTPIDHFIQENGKVVFTADKPEYKAAIIGLQRFFKDGLFDQEGFVQDNSQLNAKSQTKPAIVGAWYGWDQNVVGVENSADYVAIAPLKEHADSAAPFVRERLNHISVKGTGFTITNKAKNPEILAKWIDNFYDTHVSIIMKNGLGTDSSSNTFSCLPDWKYDMTASTSTDPSIKHPADCAPAYNVWSYIEDGILPLTVGDAAKVEVINKYYKDAPQNQGLPTISFTSEEIKLNTSTGMDIQNFVKEKQSKWLLGEEDINKDWDAYIKKLNDLKLEQYVASIQTAYSRTTAQ